MIRLLVLLSLLLALPARAQTPSSPASPPLAPPSSPSAPSAPSAPSTASVLPSVLPPSPEPSASPPPATTPHPAAHTHPAPAHAASVTRASTRDSTLLAIQGIAGLIVLLILAYLGAHPRFVRFQDRLGLGGVITAGFPFVALGAIAALPSVRILSGNTLERLVPLLHFGLGWLGFLIGAQLDVRVLDRVPKGTAYLILVETLGPFAAAGAACGVFMIAFGASISDPITWRDMILLGAAAAMTAPRKFHGFANRTWHEGRGVDVLLAQLDELVGVIGLVFITAYFREGGGTWHLPDTAWVFVSLGLGVAIGVLIFAMVRVPSSNAEFLAVVLGGIAFASGLAGYLQLSPIAICFVAGVLVKNFPSDQREEIFKIIEHLERPVHLLFLIIAGAVWTITDWRGWVLVPVFVAARIIGKWAGITATRTAVGGVLPRRFVEHRRMVTPLSGLSIALVISAFGHDKALPWLLTAVIGGAVVTELLVQIASRGEDAAAAHTPTPAQAPPAPAAPPAPETPPAVPQLPPGGPA